LNNIGSKRLRTSFVYVSEAHAENEWPIGTSRFFRSLLFETLIVLANIGNRYRTDITSPLWVAPLETSRSIEERARRAIETAKRFQLPPSVRLFADHLDRQQSFERIMGGWPTGFYVLKHTTTTLNTHPTLLYVVVPVHGMFLLDDMWKVIHASLSL